MTTDIEERFRRQHFHDLGHLAIERQRLLDLGAINLIPDETRWEAARNKIDSKAEHRHAILDHGSDCGWRARLAADSQQNEPGTPTG